MTTDTSAIIPTLQILARRIACIELFTTQALTEAMRTFAFADHPVTAELLAELARLHTRHAGALAQHATALDAEAEVAPPEPAGGAEKARPAALADADEVLIWVYTRLNLLAAHYTRLHTLAVATRADATAELALGHLRALTPKVMACSQALPLLTVRIAEMRFGDLPPDTAETALTATQAAWKNDMELPGSS